MINFRLSVNFYVETILSGRWFRLATLALASGFAVCCARAQDVKALWEERISTVVAVEFYIQSETERRPTIANGTVIDHDGDVILSGVVIPTYLPPSEFRDFRVHRPGTPNTEYSKAEYLGYDVASGWHFVRIEPSGRAGLRPITDFIPKSSPELTTATEVWGLALRGKDEDFTPLYLHSDVSFVAHLPQATAYAEGFVTGPQLPVFDRSGAFVGLGVGGFGEPFFEYSQNQHASPLILISGDHSRVFRLASDVLPYLGRVPKNKFGRPLPWLGVSSLQPLPNEVAKFLKLENQSGILVSDVLEKGPAEKAGLKERDIIVALDGKPLPRFKPSRAVVTWLEREIALRPVGSALKFTVMRGKETREVEPILVDEPKILREADRKYFERLGFSIREFLSVDAVANRIPLVESAGVVVHFVKGNSPAGVAGLRAEDWIREIDGVEIKTFAEAIQKLDTIEKDTARAEFILLASRSGETSVLRIRLR